MFYTYQKSVCFQLLHCLISIDEFIVSVILFWYTFFISLKLCADCLGSVTSQVPNTHPIWWRSLRSMRIIYASKLKIWPRHYYFCIFWFFWAHLSTFQKRTLPVHVDGLWRLSIHCPKSMYCKYLYSRKKNACILVLLSLFEKLIHSTKMSVTNSVSYHDLSSCQWNDARGWCVHLSPKEEKYYCLFHMTLPNKKIQHYLTQVVKLL